MKGPPVLPETVIPGGTCTRNRSHSRLYKGVKKLKKLKMLKKIEKVENVKKVEKILKGRTNYSFVVGRGMCYTGLRDLLRDYRISNYIITGFQSNSGLFQPNLKTDSPHN